MPTVPGAVGGFRRQALLALGGVSDATLAEDTDLTMGLCRAGWRVVYEENALAWTEVPASLNALWGQRCRWCYGTLQAMWKHRSALTQRGVAGKFGRRGLIYLLLFQVLLPLLAPAVDVFALYCLVFLNPVRLAVLYLALLLLQLVTSLYAFRLDGERPGPLWSLLLQQFVYRQLMYLVVFQSVFTALAGSRLRWQHIERYGSLHVPLEARGDPQADRALTSMPDPGCAGGCPRQDGNGRKAAALAPSEDRHPDRIVRRRPTGVWYMATRETHFASALRRKPTRKTAIRNLLIPAAGLTCVFAVIITGDSSSSEASARSSNASYAPYVSATEPSGTDSVGSPTTYNLAFVISDGGNCTPMWGGTTVITDPAVRSRVSGLKKGGATVRVSFGGASGKELAQTCGTAAELAAAYGRALDAAGSSQADFDVEGDALADSGSVALRSKAIALLQRRRPGLKVTFTLPVMPSGLGPAGLALLESANRYDVQVSSINIMTMDYGASYTGDMGGYAIASAEAAHAQLETVFGLSDAGAWRGLALTSMIGVNDVAGEIFTLSDAAQVRKFAERKQIGWVSIWSTLRDQQCEGSGSSQSGAAYDCSGVSQKPGAFGQRLAG